MVVGQGIQLLLLGGDKVGIVTFIDLESCILQSLGIVAAVDAAVVVLTKDAGTLLSICDGIILKGGLTLQIYG